VRDLPGSRLLRRGFWGFVLISGVPIFLGECCFRGGFA
jgi:hypothetical protein